MICPVEGTGANIKVLEALAYGKPVFACESAISGLPPGSEFVCVPTVRAVRRLSFGGFGPAHTSFKGGN